MYSLTDITFWLALVGIFLSFLIAFYIPGRVIIGDHKIESRNALHVIALIVGIALWAWQGYLFGLLHLRWLSYLYLLIFIGLFIYQKYYLTVKFSLKVFKKVDLIILLIGILGIGAQILPYLQTGLKTQTGVMLLNVNREDHIWHAGLISELVDRFPPNEPGIAGVPLQDYHYWFSLITADLIRVFHLPPFQTQFLGMYVLASILLFFLGYYFAKLIYDKKLFIRLFLFFLFFSGDAALWAMLIFQHTFTAQLASLINNGTKFVDSPAFAYSILIGLTGFYLLLQTKEKLSKKMIIVSALLFGSLLEIKVYTGITFMFGLGALACYAFLHRRFDRVAVFLLASLFGAFIFFPNTSASGGLFFLPFAIPRDFISQPILGLHDWELRWWIYQDHANYLRITQYGLYMTGVYLLIQFGVQLIGLVPLRKTITLLSLEKAIPFYTIMFSGIILGIFFYQKVGGANIWEFFLPVIIIVSLLTALTFTYWLEKKNLIIRSVVIVLLLVLVTPRWLLTVSQTVRNEYLTGFHGITNNEYLSYVYLNTHVPKDDVILFVTEQKSVAYVSLAKIFSNSQLYLSGEGVRQKDTPEIFRRRYVVKSMATAKKENQLAPLVKEHIRYLYYYGTPPDVITSSHNAHIVFQNKAASIVRVDL